MTATIPAMPKVTKCGWCRAAARYTFVAGERTNHSCNGCLDRVAEDALRGSPSATIAKIAPVAVGLAPEVGRIIRISHTRWAEGRIYGGSITAVENLSNDPAETNWRIEFVQDEESAGRTGDLGNYKQLSDGGAMIVYEAPLN